MSRVPEARLACRDIRGCLTTNASQHYFYPSRGYICKPVNWGQLTVHPLLQDEKPLYLIEYCDFRESISSSVSITMTETAAPKVGLPTLHHLNVCLAPSLQLESNYGRTLNHKAYSGSSKSSTSNTTSSSTNATKAIEPLPSSAKSPSWASLPCSSQQRGERSSNVARSLHTL